MDFTDDEIDRYARHLVLPEIGEEGQARLLDSRVLVVGAGGLGAPLLMYLTAAGVGTLGVVDDDRVDLSNLQRQVIHDTPSIGRAKVDSARDPLGVVDDDRVDLSNLQRQVIHDTPSIGRAKVDSARDRIAALNPEVRVETHPRRLEAADALNLIRGYDLVADGSDNFATRYLLNDACYLARRPLVSAAIMRFDGQLATFKAYDSGPCYRCVFGPQPEETRQSCADVGVLAMLPGVLGSLQAAEVVKDLLELGTGLVGRLLLYSALDAGFQSIATRRDPACPLCGESPTITRLERDPIRKDR